VRWSVVGGTATVGRDVAGSTGILHFSGATVENFAAVGILPSSAAVGGTCWYQGGTCLTFSLALSIVNGPATVGPARSTSAIVQLAPTPSLSIGVGDTLVVLPLRSHRVVAQVPVSLSTRSPTPVSVHFETSPASAVAGHDYVATSGTVRFGANQETTSVAVSVPTSDQTQPFEAFTIALSAPSKGVSLLRKTGVVLLATAGTGVAFPSSKGYGASTLTQVVSARGVGDTYNITSPGAAATLVNASSSIAAANDRVAFWPAPEAPAADQQSCATWSSQTPTQQQGTPIQEGVALRVATTGGVTRAITITKNVFAKAYYVFNVHTWTTSRWFPFQIIGSFNISSYLASVSAPELPLRVCARVVGSTFQAEVWVPGQPVPGWGTPGQGITLQLPAGWDYPGMAGYYAGHLPSNGTLAYDNEYAGAPTSAPLP